MERVDRILHPHPPAFPRQGGRDFVCYAFAVMSERRVRVTREAFRERAALDTAVSRALLRQVASGTEPETLRLYTPADVVAFGPQDTRAEGYGKATAAARSAGFEAIERLAGGRAAVFHSVGRLHSRGRCRTGRRGMM